MERVSVLETARKGALAYIGALALAGDAVSAVFTSCAKQGEAVRGEALERWEQVANHAREMTGRPERVAREQLEQAKRALERAQEQILDRLNLPTYTSVERLSEELTELSGQVDSLRRAPLRSAAGVSAAPLNGAAPLPGYERMNAETAINRLAMLDFHGLLELRAYEQQHGNRVTVLRAIERLLAAAPPAGEQPRTTVEPFPHYDELTAEELTIRLTAMHEPELAHVLAYEQEHRARQTVLRAAEERLAAKRAE